MKDNHVMAFILSSKVPQTTAQQFVFSGLCVFQIHNDWGNNGLLCLHLCKEPFCLSRAISIFIMSFVGRTKLLNTYHTHVSNAMSGSASL